jgi:hypothetical protein
VLKTLESMSKSKEKIEIVTSPISLTNPNDLNKLKRMSINIINRALMVASRITLINKDALIESLLSNWFLKFKA